MLNVANRIKETLREVGKTAYWLAKETGISTQSIYNAINNGVDIDDMNYGNVRKIALALGVSTEDLRSQADENIHNNRGIT